MTKARALVGLLVVAVALSGCKNWEDKHTEGTLIGGGVGAGLGALIGAASGSWAWGALIGLGTGALAGYVIADQTGEDTSRVDTVTGTPSEADQRRLDADRQFQAALAAKTPSESRYHLQRSIDLYPTAAAWNNMGTLHVNDGERRLAEDAFLKALDLNPNYAPARDNLARLRSGS